MSIAEKRRLKCKFRSLYKMPSCAFCSYFDIWSERITICCNFNSKFNGLCVKGDHICDDFALDEKIKNLEIDMAD